MPPTYFLRYKRQGKTAYDRLGTIKELTLAQARKLATEKKVEHAKVARLPLPEKPVLGEMSLDTFMADHYFPHAKLHKRSWVRDDQLYRIRIKPEFGESRLCDITRYQVQQFQNALSTSGSESGQSGSPHQAHTPRPEHGSRMGIHRAQPAEGRETA